MELIKGQQPVTNQKQIDKLAHRIFGKRVELFDLKKDQTRHGVVRSVGLHSFKFEDDTGGTTYFKYNDVEIKA